MFRALHTTATLDDAMDMLEIQEWAESWRNAAHENEDAYSKLAAERSR